MASTSAFFSTSSRSRWVSICSATSHLMRRVAALLRAGVLGADHDRVERLRCREGLKMPAKQPRRGRLWLDYGSGVGPRPGRKEHIRSCDFVQARTRNGCFAC